jgi:hypothetical protein
MSPSANHLDALTSCTTFTNCLNAQSGVETPVMTHGRKLSILFARASSSAPALYGLGNKLLSFGSAGLPGWADCGAAADDAGWRSEGERVGEEKERRYSPMKNSSLKRQQTKRTFWLSR